MWRTLALVAFSLQLWSSPPHEEPDARARDAWQRPDAVMDALRIGPGTRVADIGAGSGYFTFHLARRVGPRGQVYAVDIDRAALVDISARASSQHLVQVKTILGTEEDPRLPDAGLDVVLVVNTYHELRAFDAMTRGLWRGLKPGGLLGVIDCEALPGELPGRAFRYHRIASRVVREDAGRSGFRMLRQELGFVDPTANLYSSYWFFLIFERPV